jgi:hypothetical protein
LCEVCPGQLTGGGDEQELARLIQQRLAAAGAGAEWDAMAARMAALALEEAPRAGAAVLQEVAWGGQRVPLRNTKVATLLAAAAEQQQALADAASRTSAFTESLAAYDRLLGVCADAVAAAQVDLAADQVRVTVASPYTHAGLTRQCLHHHRCVYAYPPLLPLSPSLSLCTWWGCA